MILLKILFKSCSFFIKRDTENLKANNLILKNYISSNKKSYFKYSLVGYFSYLFYYNIKYNKDGDLNKYLTIRVSKFAGRVCEIKLPNFLKKAVFKTFINTYKVNEDEILEKDYTKYNTINDFFIRKIDIDRCRKIDTLAKIVSPCDGTILSISEIKNSQDLIIVKDKLYNIFEFLFGKLTNEFLISDVLSNKEKLYQITIYLSPANYHRYHSPCNLKVEERFYIPGYLYPVKPSFVEENKNTFLWNERVTLKCKTEENKNIYITYVGALNVGSINLNFDNFSNSNHLKIHEYNRYNKNNPYEIHNLEDNAFTKFDSYEIEHHKNAPNSDLNEILIKKGEEMGYFKFGSTIVLIFSKRENEEFPLDIKEGNKISLGNKII